MSARARWIEPSGGPLIIVPASMAASWRGRRGTQVDDYTAACSVDGYTGVIARAWGACIVLNDEPLRTTVVQSAAGETVVRWIHAPDEEALMDRVNSFSPNATDEVERLAVPLLSEAYVIWDAACSFEAERSLGIFPNPSAKALVTYLAQPDAKVAFLYQRFE